MTIAARVLDLGPSEFGPFMAAAGRDASRAAGPAGDLRFLAPDHPFLDAGTWRAFVVGEGATHTRIVASLDPRQRGPAGSIGAIGFIETAGDLRASPAQAPFLTALDAAEAWLRDKGATVIRGPLQFATWYGHRTVMDAAPTPAGVPRFPMEPYAVPGLTDVLSSREFVVAHSAASYLVDVERWIGATGFGEKRMLAAGFRDRALRLDRLDDDLKALYDISLSAFRGAWAFSQITIEEFAAIYRPLVPLVDPDFVRILERPSGEPVGFFFAFPDPTVPPGLPGSRVIAKTVAIRPDVQRATRGLGASLTLGIHRRASARGYRNVVHACVAMDAYSQRLSARWGERFRTYATFEKRLR